MMNEATLALFGIISIMFNLIMLAITIIKKKPNWFFEEESNFSKNFDIKAD